MPSITVNNIETSRTVETSKMQLESLELAGCTLDRYIVADNSRPSFLEVCKHALLRFLWNRK